MNLHPSLGERTLRLGTLPASCVVSHNEATVEIAVIVVTVERLIEVVVKADASIINAVAAIAVVVVLPIVAAPGGRRGVVRVPQQISVAALNTAIDDYIGFVIAHVCSRAVVTRVECLARTAVWPPY